MYREVEECEIPHRPFWFHNPRRGTGSMGSDESRWSERGISRKPRDVLVAGGLRCPAYLGDHLCLHLQRDRTQGREKTARVEMVSSPLMPNAIDIPALMIEQITHPRQGL